MRPVNTFVVHPVLPDVLSSLRTLAMNFWWCWHPEAIALFSDIDADLWVRTQRNPVEVLGRVTQQRLRQLADDTTYLARLQSVTARFEAYMADRGWYVTMDGRQGKYVAYFCAEFGIHESFPIYSGGLGVLAGDHLKAASDLGLPLVAVGLLYQEGYFHQFLTQNGWQNESYSDLDFHNLPLQPMQHADGQPIVISVELPAGTCHARIWKASIGRIPLYLLDTNVPENALSVLRSVTDRLYGGTVDTRIMQETVLGIGGMRALQALGIDPSVIHINEGHAAFSMLERSRMNMNKYGLTFREAWAITQASSVFTTHTPVPAGNEIFNFETMTTYFTEYVKTLGISWEQFCLMGSQGSVISDDGFSMTVLGLRGAFHRNGVSELHGHVARSMWHGVWSGVGLDEVPIAGLTNGIHTSTWVAPEIAAVFDAHLGRQWRNEPHQPEAWSGVDAIPDAALWAAHEHRRERLVLGARAHVLRNHDLSLSHDVVQNIDHLLNPRALTIGFARRFASYKRADLLLYDIERLARIVTDTDRPVQFVLAGKAHPRDVQGKELLSSVIQKTREHNLHMSIVFLEDYEMDIARLLVRGCDIWLNTPRRPYEASGTSGMKAVLNGALHCSILDGWWAEAYDGSNGFAIGRGEMASSDAQDHADASTLYDLLEHVIVPLYYNRNAADVPEGWMRLVKNSIRTLSPKFSASRMVRQYVTEMYLPALDAFDTITNHNAAPAGEFVRFLDTVQNLWPSVTVGNVEMSGESEAFVGKRIDIRATIELAGLVPDQVIVQAVYGRIDGKGDIFPARTTTMTCVRLTGMVAYYEGRYACEESGLQGCTVRVMPAHGMLEFSADAHAVAYANE